MQCSIVIASRNHAQLLHRTLASIRRQAVPFAYELIVVDDGSTDDTPLVCRRHAVKYQRLENDRYRNPSAARNAGCRLARGEVVIMQSDEVIHGSPRNIERLVRDLARSGEFLIGTVFDGDPGGKGGRKPVQYTGAENPRPLFFLGSLRRWDLYAAGGNDEEFTEPGYEDNWFADCLIHGLGLKPRYHPGILGWHQPHPRPHDLRRVIEPSRRLYQRKSQAARRGEIPYRAARGAWGESREPEGREVSRGESLERDGSGKPASRDSRIRTLDSPIPKRVFFYHGFRSLSFLRFLSVSSFQRHHPEFDVRVMMPEKLCTEQTWTTGEHARPYCGPDYTDWLARLPVEIVRIDMASLGLSNDLPEVHKSDILRNWLLVNEGGYWSDMDVFYVGRLSIPAEADTVYCHDGDFYYIGLIGGSPGSEFYRHIFQESLRARRNGDYQGYGTRLYRRRPAEYGAMFPSLSMYNLPMNAVYPIKWIELDRLYTDTSLPPDCAGIHWFGGSRIGGRLERGLTHETSAHDNLVYRKVRELCEHSAW